MRFRPLRREPEPKLMIIPMIDIIFFLLIFFMMSMLSMSVQSSIDLSLPQASAARTETAAALPVAITADGQIYVEKEPVAKGDFLRRMEIEQERQPGRAVLIRADAASRHSDFVFVLDQLKAAGIHRVGIAAEAAPEG